MRNIRIRLLIFNKWFHVVAVIPLFVVNGFTHANVRAAGIVAAVVLSLLSINVNISTVQIINTNDMKRKDFFGKSNDLILNIYKK